MEDSINNVEDLANQKQIEYGLVRSGSTRMFFEVCTIYFDIHVVCAMRIVHDLN